MKYIYIVRTVSVNGKTEEDLKKEFEITKINHSIWVNKSYEDFVKFQTSWKNNKYFISCDDLAYCYTYEIAYDKVINNCCDMNDGGVYNYVAILTVPINQCYAVTFIQREDIVLFKFDYNQRKYFEITECNEFINFIKDKSIGIFRS